MKTGITISTDGRETYDPSAHVDVHGATCSGATYEVTLR